MKDKNKDDNIIDEIIDREESNVEFEDLSMSGEEKSLNEKLKDLREKLKEKTEEAKVNLDGWQRARAELVNKDKQLQNEKLEIYKNASASLLEEIIPVLDSYEMAKKNKNAWEKVEENWRKGVEYIFQQLLTVTENTGLKKIKVSVGDKFDLNTMQSVDEEETEDENKNQTVSEIIQSGYELNGKLLREAKVKIFVKK